MTTPLPIEEAFPPKQPVPFSVRVQQIDEYKNPEIRKVLHTIYKNADGSPVMDYYKALSTPPSGVRAALLEHEISKGYVVDDRNASSTPTVIVPMPKQEVVPEMVKQPLLRVPDNAPVAPPGNGATGPTEAAPVMQPPPVQEMPTGRGRRGRASALGAAVAPPPPPPNGMVLPPNGSNPIIPLPQDPPPAAVMAAPQVPMTPMAPPQVSVFPQGAMSPAPIPVPMPQMASPAIPGDLLTKLDAFGAGMGQLLQKANAQDSDMKQIVSNLSAQISETNKVLAKVAQSLEEITRLQNVTFVALHHLYLSSPYAQSAGEQGKNAKLFAQYLEQFVPK